MVMDVILRTFGDWKLGVQTKKRNELGQPFKKKMSILQLQLYNKNNDKKEERKKLIFKTF